MPDLRNVLDPGWLEQLDAVGEPAEPFVLPAADSDPKGYCQADRSSPRNASVRSVIWSSLQAQTACMLAAIPSRPNLATSSGWISCRCAMWWRRVAES